MVPSVQHLHGEPVALSDPSDQDVIEAACVALNGRLAKLVGLGRRVVRRKRQNSSNYRNGATSCVKYRTAVEKKAAAVWPIEIERLGMIIRYYRQYGNEPQGLAGNIAFKYRTPIPGRTSPRCAAPNPANFYYETGVITDWIAGNLGSKDTKPKGFTS
jgi:hypothetical protein